MERAWQWCKRKPVVSGLSAVIVLGAVFGSIIFWERTNAAEASGLVDALATAEPEQVSGIIGDLDRLSWWATPLLQQQVASADESPDAKRARLHARIALAESDPSLAIPLFENLLNAELRQIANIRDALERCPDSQIDRLWAVFRGTLGDPKPTEEQRFRAGLALVGLDTDNEKWQPSDHEFLVEQMLGTNPVFQSVLWDLLRPQRTSVIKPIEVAFKDSDSNNSERLAAANALADLAADDIPRLASQLSFATPEQFEVIFPLVAASPTPSIVKSLANRAATLPPDDLGSVERITFGQRRANAAISLLRMGEREQVLPVFNYTDDPEALTQFIFRCRERGVGAEPLLELLDKVTRSVSKGPRTSRPASSSRLANASGYQADRVRYALLLALGEFQLEEIPETRRDILLEQLADWYANDPSSGVHGAAGWLLRHWGQTEMTTRIDQTPVPYSPDREWFTLAITVTPTQNPKPSDDATEEADENGPATSDNQDESDGDETNSKDVTADAEADEPAEESVAEPVQTKTFYYTFIVFPAGDYMIGSVADESMRSTLESREERHQVTLTRPIAILDREVTMEELAAFSPLYVKFMQLYDTGPIESGFGADWYDAVAFCRWLGEQMKLQENQQAYTSPQSLDPDEYPRDPNPSANWAPRDWPVHLDRRGFRLPTEAEWEVVARAGARTAYGFGSEVRLLGRFGWFTDNSGKRVHAPRELRPSIRGVFDLHGNIYEWTHDWYDDFGSVSESDPVGPLRGEYRVFRGGTWDFEASVCRTAIRSTRDPASRTNFIGFRLALSPSGGSSPAEQEVGAKPAGAVTQGATAEPRPEMP